MATIKSIEARKILDSRDKETIEVKVSLDDGMMAIDSVPSGTSTGSFESVAIEPNRAIQNINQIIAPKLIGLDPREQRKIDMLMIELDKTKDKSGLGANAILGVSLAVSRAASMSEKMPLYRYLNWLFQKETGIQVKPSIPTPMMVMIEGGKHGSNPSVCIQEFLCITSVENGGKIWKALKNILNSNKLDTHMGLEGGFVPKLEFDEDAIRFIMQAITQEKLTVPNEVKIGLDVAANNCQISHDDILALLYRYPIFSLEDPIQENNWHEWAQLKLELDQRGKEYLLVGDDLFVTNHERLQKGVSELVANAIIIKLNQVGTVTETLEVVAMAMKAKYTHILSHRSGETMDTYISDLAVATGAKYLKAGAPYASERVIKYNRLREIEREL